MIDRPPPGKVNDPHAQGVDEVNVFTEPSNARVWLDMLGEAEKVFEDWQQICDEIDKKYANLERLSSSTREREFQMFWANMQVLAPSIYARPPVPVVVPKFKDRDPVIQSASEMAERCAVVAFDMARLHDTMLLVRDDLSLHGRGVVWLRHERGKSYKPEKVCIEHKDRHDFVHSPARCWYEVQWVGAASYLTREEAKKRFGPYSGDAYDTAEYKIDKDIEEVGGADERERAKIWEVWHRGVGKVVWIAEGVDVLLDEVEPHLDLQDYFPCPQPVYGTCQPGSLVPVPDSLYYSDQLEELNQLTGRISALCDALRVKGFYPAGGEIGDAIELALKVNSNNQVMVPLTNWAAFGGSKEVVVWLPIDQVANTITAAVGARKQIIDDIYQIVGLSDIMRGSSDPEETLGAQQLKMQSGSVRIRDKQGEMVRLGKDCVTITTEIITEKFADQTILEMSQVKLPSEMDIAQQIQALQMQAIQLQQHTAQTVQQPQMQMAVQQNPQQAAQLDVQQKGLQQALQKQMASLAAKPTREKVLRFLRDNRARAFVLDIETDSTIQLDEQFEKQQRTEFLGMLSQLLPQLGQMIMLQPQTATFAGEILKFATAPYRVGRQLDGAIDDMVQTMSQQAASGQGQGQPGQQGNQEDPAKLQLEREKLQAQQAENEKDRQLQLAEMTRKHQLEQAKLQNEREVAMLEFQGNERERQAKIVQIQANMQADREKARIDAQKAQADFVLNTQKQQIQMRGQNEKNQMVRQGMLQKAQDNAINRQQKAAQFNQTAQQKQGMFDRQQANKPFNPNGPGP